MTVPVSPASLLRRWGVWAAVIVAVTVALLVGAQRTSHPTLDQRTQSLASQVRCPVCGGESAAQSSVPAAADIRDRIHQELAAGIPAARVLDDITKSYGTWILERPPTQGVGLVVWVAPVAAVGAATAGLVLAFARWRRPGRLAGGGAPGEGGLGGGATGEGGVGGGALGEGGVAGGFAGRPGSDEELVARALARDSQAGDPTVRGASGEGAR